MANPLTNEKELYDRIRDEHIVVPLLIWDLMYHYLGDDISAITQITLSYWKYDQPIPVEDAKKIMKHTEKITAIIKKILHYERIEAEDQKLDELKDKGAKLHPVIHELFFHYIGNDVHGINMIIGFHLDPVDTHPVPVEDAEKILNKTATMKQFMDRLREATQQEVRLTGEEG